MSVDDAAGVVTAQRSYYASRNRPNVETLGSAVMTEQARDNPDVIVFPPVIPCATIALAFLLQWLIPLGALGSSGSTWRIALGIVLVLAGIAISASGLLALKQAGTNVDPSQPVTTLVHSGIFKWTRNPIYVGGALIMIGIALIFALDWLLLLFLPSYALLHVGVVMREERYLERKFGDAYRRYKETVPRYFWPF
jgi:protein-S-isoprenylcysteine O-methyltransferase Ste14